MPGSDVLAGLTFRNTVSAVILIIASFAMGRMHTIQTMNTMQFAGFTASAILGGTIGLAFFYGALKIAPASRIIPLTATFPMISYILSIWLLKEAFTLKGFIGVVCIVLGAVLLA